MKNMTIAALLILFLPFTTLAQAPDAAFNISTFTTPDHESYAEAYLIINPNSLSMKKARNGYTAGAEVTILFKSGDDIINFDKFDLIAPAKQDSGIYRNNLIAVRRIAIPTGNYAAEVVIKDLNNTEAVTTLPSKPLSVDFVKNAINISDIQLIDSFANSNETSSMHKSGFFITPHPLDFYNSEETEIKYYVEVYNLDKIKPGEDVLITTSIRKKGESRPAGNFHQYYKQKAQPVNVVLGNMNIADLPSGNYNMILEVRDRNNTLLAQKMHLFQRSNKKAVTDLENLKLVDPKGTFVEGFTEEELGYFLRTQKAISDAAEIRATETLLAMDDKMAKQQFLYNFWVTRDLTKPLQAFEEYQERVKYVNREFPTITRKGFETERGRVYLQYGPPTDIVRSAYESSSKPYEIWQYNRLPSTNEINVIFVFYNDDLVSNEYRLIHSTATGEIRNDRWKLKVYDEQDQNFDNSRIRDRYGNDQSDPFGN